MTYGFISTNADKRITEYLTKKGITPVLLPEYSRLDKPVSTHADMLLFVANGNIITYGDYYNDNASLFECAENNIITENKIPSKQYPGDIGLNFLEISGTLYGRTDFVAPSLSQIYTSMRFIKQGYACCSSLKLSDKAVITQDSAVEKALTADNIDVLEISSGNIILEGYNTGFIGGAGALLPCGELIFFGKISEHPDYEKVASFCEKYGIKITEFDFPLTDYGGIKFFEA